MQALTADSEWRPPSTTLASLPYGGNLQEAVRENDRAAVRAIQAAWGMAVLATDEQIDATLNAAHRQASAPAAAREQAAPAEAAAELSAAIALSLQTASNSSTSAAGPSSNTPAVVPSASTVATPVIAPVGDVLTAWCLQHRFAELEPALRVLGVQDLEDLKYVTEDELLNMGLRGPACRRFFEKANQAMDQSRLNAALAVSLADAPQTAANATVVPPPPVTDNDAPAPPADAPATPLAPTKTDSALARELQDAEMARDMELQMLEERHEALGFDCPVCLERQPVDGSFTGGCDHRVCGVCIYEHVASKVEAEEVSERQLRCVLCPEPLAPAQVQSVLETYGRDDLVQAFLEQRLRSTASSGPFCKCPRCEVVHALSDEQAAGPGERSSCVSCEHPFCSRCAAPRYHYFHAGERDPPDCALLMRQKEAAWLQWRAEGQAAYVERLAQVDTEYAQQLRAYETEVTSSRQAYAAFQADEQAKQGWVHCPHCNVVWAGSDACPEVTCGVLEQAMGQRRAGVGCGRQFNLQRDGIPYRPVTAPPPQPAASRPERPATVTHEHVMCDKCGDPTSPIQGVRIRCLHCPSYNLCLPCLAQHGPDHDAEEEWPGREEAPHVFEVLHEPVPH